MLAIHPKKKVNKKQINSGYKVIKCIIYDIYFLANKIQNSSY